MQIVVTLLIFTILVNLVLGSLVFSRASKKAYGLYYAVAVFGISLWTLGALLLINGRTELPISLGALLFYAGPLIIPVGILFFSYSFPINSRIPRYAYVPAVASFLFWTYIVLFQKELLVNEIIVTDNVNVVIPNKGVFMAYASHFSIFFAVTYLVLLKRFQETKGLQRNQISYTLIGVLVGSILGMTTNIVLPVLDVYTYIWLGPIATLSFTALATTAIAKHKLFDIRLVIARSLGYVLSLAILIAIYSFAISLPYLYLEEELASSSSVRFAITIVLLSVAAISFAPLKRYFDKITNKIFYQDAYDPQEFLNELNRAVLTSVDLQPLLEKSAEIISRNLKNEFTTFGLRETAYAPQRIIGTQNKTFSQEDINAVRAITPHIHHRVIVTDEIQEQQPELYERLNQNDIAVITRLTPTVKYEIEGIGYLVLGPKKSGNPYSKNDVRIIGIISGELVVAIQNALRFEEIEKFSITLQEKVDDATKKLKRTNDKLITLDETKDEFISMASHQLRTPLTSVKGYLSMVLEGDAGELNPMQKKLLDQAFVSSQRMVYLIADLLNVSRLRTGKFVIERIPTNLADVVEGEVEQLKETAAGRGLKLIYKKPKKFPELMLDETKIRQVIMNFTDNAIYYTPTGGKITVELKETVESVQCTVTDTGIGVPKSEQHHLFNKFYRAGNAKKARPDGTGLGLFMAKKVIIAQGGALIFHTQEGKGSTFGFSFAKAKLAVPDSGETDKR